MRDTLFIGHANPQDNDFTIWLYSKLELEGYKVWCDLESLYGGESDFWDEIQATIRKNACKYILVFSRDSFQKDSVKDEFEYARSIEKEFKLKDFIIPLRIDNVPFNERIGLNRRNILDFRGSWIPGLRNLFLKLAKDKIPKNTDGAPAISDWIFNIHLYKNSALYNEEELHYSNWWQIESLPENIYIFQYMQESLAQAIIEEDADYPVIKHGNYLISFERNIKNISEKNNNMEINPLDIQSLSIKDILSGYDSDNFPTQTDSENFLKRLLKKAFKNLVYERGLLKKELSNDQCFFYRHNTLKKDWAIAKYPNRDRRKKLVGKYYKYFWHLAVSTRVMLEPFVCYSLKSHILFSDDGFNIWKDDARLHSARRSKGKKWFNEEWRDQLMALINSLANGKNKVKIKLEDNFILEMPLVTKEFYSDIGYDEPETKERLNILHDSDESLYEFDELDEKTETRNPN